MAASNATMIFRAIDNGELYEVDCYVPDAVATNFTFNGVGLASSTSTAYWSAPEDCELVEITVVASPTAVGGVILFDGSPVKNHTFRHSANLVSLNNRPKQSLYIPAGTQVGVLQF